MRLTLRSSAASVLGAVFIATAVGGCKRAEPANSEADAKADGSRSGAGAEEDSRQTALPAKRPTPFAVNYQIERAIDSRDSLKLGDDVSLFGTTRGRRHFNATFTSPQAELDRVHAVLHTHACDRIETKIERSTDNTGTILQLRVGKLRHVINDRGQFFPAPEWADAYKACASALDEGFPKVGDAPHTSFAIRFPTTQLPVPLIATIDVGPDFLGASWDEAQTTVSVDIAKVRPLEVTVRSGQARQSTLLDLSKHVAIELSYEGAPDDESFKVLLTPVEGDVHRHGDVPDGTDVRAKAPEEAVAEPTDAPDPKSPKPAPDAKAPAGH